MIRLDFGDENDPAEVEPKGAKKDSKKTKRKSPKTIKLKVAIPDD